MNINIHIKNHGKVRSGKVGSQYNHAKILELGTGFVGWIGLCNDEGFELGAREYQWSGTVSLVPCVRN